MFRKVDAPDGGQPSAFDWRLGIGVDYSDIFAPITRLRDVVVLATLAIVVSVALVGVWLGRSVSLSVREFTHFVSEAAAGRFDLISSTASQAEISELSQAMNQLFVSMRQQSDAQPIPNPYVVGNPVRSAAMFYGRQDDLRWIDERLTQPGNEMILLYGQRRIGKTSLLHQIRNQRESGSILPVFVDTHGLLPMLLDDDSFYAGLMRTISRELPMAPGESPGAGQTAEHLLAMIRSLNLQFPTRTLVLLFDEVDALDMKIRDGTLSSEVTSFLGSLLESDCRMSIIATGWAEGSRLGGPFWSVLAPKSIARRIGLLSPAEGMRLIHELVPVMLQRMLAVPPQRLVQSDTSSLRVVAVSGSALGRRLAIEVADRWGPVLYNTYGSTEVAVATVATPADLREHPTTVGRAAPGVRVELLDEAGNAVPTGAVGRIFVGNSARFDGYTGGGSKEARHGLLSSGDVGHFDDQQLLYIDGRDDDMIVSGGENVFPAEVEDLLTVHSEIVEAAVIGVDDEEFGQALAAFVVRRDGSSLDVEGVKSHVRENLARFKVPRRVTFLDELPRNPAGKVLKRSLPS